MKLVDTLANAFNYYVIGRNNSEVIKIDTKNKGKIYMRLEEKK